MSLDKKLNQIQIKEDKKHLLAKIGQYALITDNENRVLILKRVGEEAWSLPGGRLNKGEEWDKSFIREVKEEINLDCNNIQPFDVNILEDPYQIKYCIYFSVNVSNIKRLRISNEHTDSKWIDIDEINQIKLDDEKVKKVVKNYIDYLSKSGR